MDIMNKSIFKISKMDCPSEEQLIRMKLEGVKEIEQMDFDIPSRTLDVIHKGDKEVFEQLLYSLNLDAQFVESSKLTDFIKNEKGTQQRRILWWVLAINFSFFAIEMFYGWISNSLGLIADSLDMLADSLVYGLSLLAVGREASKKKQVAKLSGYFQILLAVFGLIEVLKRFLGAENMPLFENMIVISILALLANSVSLYLIQKSKSKEAHMQASMIFTSNDIVINLGVIIAGVLVYYTNSKYPDLIVGFIIFLVVIRGAFRILKLSKN